jgi:hypothetical protein
MVRAFRWQSNSLEPIVTTHSKPSHSLMPSHPCRESEDTRAVALIAYWVTVVMTRRQSGKVCVTGASSLCSRCATQNTAVA